jgi:hypothetical protein
MNPCSILVLLCIVILNKFDAGAALSLDAQAQRRWRLPNIAKKLASNPARVDERDEETKSINQEMYRVSFFSFLHSAAMPFADLVDGSFLSTLDANSLGAVGVVRACQVSTDHEFQYPVGGSIPVSHYI